MDDNKLWVGIDLGSRLLHICIVDWEGIPVHEQQAEASAQALEEALSAFPIDRIGLIAVEAGAGTHILRPLLALGFPVTIFEARKARRFLALRRSKTDVNDARGLADLARLGRHTVSPVYLKSPECEQLRSLLTIRRRLVLMRVSADNALRSRLQAHGLRFPSKWRKGAIDGVLDDLLAELGPDREEKVRSEVEPLVELCTNLRTSVKRLSRELEARAKAEDVCRLMMGVPGVGYICALSFYSAIEDPDRFERPSDVAAYFGLIPRRHESGGQFRTRGITKTGNRVTRARLFNAAQIFGIYAPDSELKRWFSALSARAGGKRARVALARKLSILLLTMWKTGNSFQPFPNGPPADPAVPTLDDEQLAKAS